jgi:hypothetical protein
VESKEEEAGETPALRLGSNAVGSLRRFVVQPHRGPSARIMETSRTWEDDEKAGGSRLDLA